MAKLVIEARQSEKHYWADLWRYRELFLILAWRDVAVRYKQTVIGIAWALLQPALTVVVFTILFSRLAKLPADGTAPYPLMVLAGMLPWQFFASALSASSQSLIGNSALISKVYFPRMIVPVGTVVTALIDFLITCVLLFGMMAYYRFVPGLAVLLSPLFVMIAFLAALGPGLLLTALTVRFRDFRFVVPFLVQFGFFVSPVGFSTAVIPERWRLLYSLNPMVGVIDGFRWALLGGQSRIFPTGLAISLATVVFFLVVGIWYFRRTERTFADII